MVDDRTMPSGSLPTCDTTRGLQMFARNTNGTTLDKQMQGIALRNFRMFRFNFNAAEIITDLLVEIVRNPNALRLRTLEGL